MEAHSQSEVIEPY